MKTGNYYVGLDMGTNSVGWAVTDSKYNLIRAKGKDLWGIREFEEARTAADRRSKRVARRRRQRQQVMMGLIRSYFEDEINKIDSQFFQRLDNSFYYLEDKDNAIKDKNVLFNDKNYIDKDYFHEYPTIFHLRKSLIDGTARHDVRFVYLAIINMFKHRGHFLNASLDSDHAYIPMKEILSIFDETASALEKNTWPSLSDFSEQIDKILCDRKISKSKKTEKLNEILGLEKKDEFCEFVKVICGLKSNTAKLFKVEGDETEKKDICFSDAGFDDSLSEIMDVIGEENTELLNSMKNIYDCGVLGEILSGYSFLSEARVALYKKHGDDLKSLKRILKKYNMENEYDFLFREAEAGTYSSYVGSVNCDGNKQRRGMKGRSKEDFYKTVKKILDPLMKSHPQDQDIAFVLEEISKDTFMPKQLTSSNGVIPNQVHAIELKMILKNAEEYLSFLKNKDESGLTVSERIVQLFSYQIPYFIGPTSDKSEKSGGNGWVVRKEPGPVLPWNIEEKIDIGLTNEKFIEKLVRTCTYISGEKVLPKNSILYQKYVVLNEINNIRIDGEKISVELKQDIFNELFLKSNRVTRQKLIKYLNNRGCIQDETQISGLDIKINSGMSTYAKFYSLFGDKMKEDSYVQMAEEIIFLCTVYGDSKKYLRERLIQKCGDSLSEDEIKKIMTMKFSDWGRLSREYITLAGCDKTTGEECTLIGALWNTNLNAMELINNDQFTFHEVLESRRAKDLNTLKDFKSEDLADYYYSAPVKRMIWQTIQILREIESVMGCSPEKVFVEMARRPEDRPKRKDSRKQMFLELYKNIKDEDRNWKELIEREDETGRLRSKKMYLYLTQMGRDMYTGDPIDLDKLFDNNLYDIDHIYPRHYVKDDSIENNLVLVYKPQNANKSDIYPLEKTIRDKQYGFWKGLRNQKLISEEKFNRLVGTKPFTEDQLAGFIARQMVETQQGTKGVAELLGTLLEDSRIVYVKAGNVSDFRRKYGFPKSRIVNDFHHANDAYLNIVVGNVYDVKFTQNPLRFIKDEYLKDKSRNQYNLDKMFDRNIERNGKIAWKAPTEDGEQGTIVTVRRVISKNTPLMTRLSFVGHGQISDETLYGHDDAKAGVYIPFKSRDARLSNVERYGGYNKASIAYFFLVESDNKGKRERTLESVPIYLSGQIKTENDLINYCLNTLGLIKPSIRIAKIRIQSLVEKNGFRFHITGKTNDRLTTRSATSLYVGSDKQSYIHKIEKYIDTGVIEEIMTKEKNIELYDLLTEKHCSGVFSKRPNPVGEKLKLRKEKFKALELPDQLDVLNQVLTLSSIGKAEADLTKIDESKKTGVMLISKKISPEDPVILISQSAIGLYENRINMATV